MTLPTSPKPHTPTDLTVSKDAGATLDNDAAKAGLRTALTKAIHRADPPGGMRAGTPSISVAVLRTLLAAHPAPETARSGHDIACDADYLDASCICDELTPAPTPDARRPAAEARCLADTSWEHHDRTDDFPCSACSSDTRREDVAREIAEAHWTTMHEGFQCVGCGWRDVGRGEDYGHAARRHVAEVALAARPAPLVEHLTFGGERCVYCGANYLDVVRCEVTDPGERRVRFMQALGEFREAAAPPVVDEAERGARALDEAADAVDLLVEKAGQAESAGFQPGTVGPGSAIDARDAIWDDPARWLRARATALRGADRG